MQYVRSNLLVDAIGSSITATYSEFKARCREVCGPSSRWSQAYSVLQTCAVWGWSV